MILGDAYMKYIIYTIVGIIGFFLFVPLHGSSEIRNFPLFVLLVSLNLIAIMVRLFKYLILMTKAKKLLQQKGMRPTRIIFFPWLSRFHGRYSMMFQHEGKNVQIMFLSRKRKYQRYHFDGVHHLEFYNTNRVVFKGSKIRGATISNAIETNMVGKQKLKWDETASIRVILFDKFPDIISDSVNKEALAAGDRIGNEDVYLLDWANLCHLAN